jgi:membrane protease YdiL (CAAX protease family)
VRREQALPAPPRTRAGKDARERVLAGAAILACGAAVGLPYISVLVAAVPLAVLHVVGLRRRLGVRFASLPLAVVAATGLGRYTVVDWKVLLAIVAAVVFLPSWASGPTVRKPIRDTLRRPDALSFGLAVTATCVGVLVYEGLRPESGSVMVFGPHLGVSAILALAVLNSVAEEGCWRGLLWTLAARCGVGSPALVVVTSLSFGLAHLVGGVPSGTVGFVETTALGLVLGLLRLRTGSLALPVAVHAILDVVVLIDLYGL